MDEVLQLAGDGEPRVFCKRAIALASGDAEHTCTVLIDIDNSPLLEVEVAAASIYKEDLWAIQGTQGGLRGSMNELFWKTCNVASLPPRPVEEQPTPNRSYNSEKLEWNQEQSWKVADDFEGSQALYYKALHEALVNDSEVRSLASPHARGTGSSFTSVWPGGFNPTPKAACLNGHASGPQSWPATLPSGSFPVRCESVAPTS